MLEPLKRVEKYTAQSLHYLQNASKYLDKEDTGKASELLWGSLAEAAKALALSHGISLDRHWEIGDFMKEVAKNLEDKDIYDVYLHANSLHKNFYEIEIGLDDVRRMAEDVRITVGKLLGHIPKP